MVAWVNSEGKILKKVLFERSPIKNPIEGEIVRLGDPTTDHGKEHAVPHQITKVEQGEFQEEEITVVTVKRTGN
jgi:hypothetical protein